MNILCYGDSNTYGYDPRGYFGGRYDQPWPQILAERTGWSVENCGENGREIPVFPVKISKETDLLMIMLGTNDLLQSRCVQSIAKRMEVFLEGLGLDGSRILLIAPPPMKPGTWVQTQSLEEASGELAQAYRALSLRLGISFVNAGDWGIPLSFDGVHFTEEGHQVFAEGLIHYLTKEGYQYVSE